MHSDKWCLAGHFIAILNQENFVLSLSLQSTLHWETPLLKSLACSSSILLFPHAHGFELYESRKGRAHWEQNRGATTGTPIVWMAGKLQKVARVEVKLLVLPHNSWELPHLSATRYSAFSWVLAPEENDSMMLPSWEWFMWDILVSSHISKPPRSTDKSEMQFPIMCVALRVWGGNTKFFKYPSASRPQAFQFLTYFKGDLGTFVEDISKLPHSLSGVFSATQAGQFTSLDF